MKLQYAVAALLLATSAASAQAQTGLRADVHVGWDQVSSRQRTDVGSSGATTKDKAEGTTYGVEVGYDVPIHRFRLGVYGGYDSASTKKCSEVYAEVETCVKANHNWTLGARLGVMVTNRVLVYGKGGYSNGRVQMQAIDHATPANSFSTADTRDGYHVGAGVQVGLIRNIYAKLEYVRTDYRDYIERVGNATISGGLDRDNVTFGVGVAF